MFNFYLNDYVEDKNMKVGIAGLEGNLTLKEHSHNAGLLRLIYTDFVTNGYKNSVIITKDNDCYNECDFIVFYLGVNYSGNINYFGGLNDTHVDFFKRLQETKQQTLSMYHPLPDIVSDIKNRKELSSTSKRINELDINLLSTKLLNTSVIKGAQRKTHLLFGDSHSPNVWEPDYHLVKKDGLTLYSTLYNKGLDASLQEIIEMPILGLKHLKIQLGNIDLRHHLCRQKNSSLSAQMLSLEFVKQVKEVQKKYYINEITLVELMPIENESRVIPKTGFYKGTGFFGTWKERNDIRNLFNADIECQAYLNGWNYHKYNNLITDEKGELSEKCMERPRSVHLSPRYYLTDLFK